MSAADTKRVEALDLARVLAMLAVIMIHVSSTYIHSPSGYTLLGMNLAFWCNQLARFAVPLFVLISGTALGLSGRQEGAAAFWARRLWKIGVPYIVWTLLYQLWDAGRNPAALAARAAEHPGAFLRTVLLGQAAPHLYFVVILLQCYALYPLLRRMVVRAPVAAVGASVAVTHFIQQLYLFKRCGLDLIPDAVKPYLWLSFPTWAFYFVLGCALSRNVLLRGYELCRKHPVTVIGCTAVYAFLFVVETNLTQSLESIKAALDPYVLLALASSFALWGWVERWGVVRSAVRFLARHSMTVYFGHVLLLYGLRGFSPFRSGMAGMLALYLAVTVLAVVLATVVDGAAGFLKQKRAA